MTPDLRPLSLGELLDRAITIYRKNFITLIGIAAVVSIPLLAAQLVAALVTYSTNPFLSGNFTPGSNPFAQTLPLLISYAAAFILAIIRFIAGTFQTGALAVVVSESYHGRRSSIKQAYGTTLRRWASLLLGLIIVGLANLALMLIVALPFFGTLFISLLPGTS